MNLRSLDIDDLKSAFKRVKAAVLNLSETEQKVREATNNEPWACSTALLGDITHIACTNMGFNEVMAALYGRLSQEGRTWRNIYKSLVLLDYLLKNGPERVASYARGHMYDVKACLNYAHVDEKGRDQGINVRHRAKLVLEMLENNAILSSERQKVRESKTSSSQAYSSNYNNSGYSSTATQQPSFSFSTGPPATALAPAPTAPAAAVQSANLFSFEDDVPAIPASRTGAPAAASGSSSGEEDWADFAAAPSGQARANSAATKSSFQDFIPRLSNCPPMMPPPTTQVSQHPQISVSLAPVQMLLPVQPAQPAPQATPMTAAEMMWSNIDNLMNMNATKSNTMQLSSQTQILTPSIVAPAVPALNTAQSIKEDDTDSPFSQFVSAPQNFKT